MFIFTTKHNIKTMKNMFVRLVIICILCISMVSASVIRDVKVKTPTVVSPNEKFNIFIEIGKDLPTVVGVTLKIPDGFTLVNCSTPYKVLGNKMSLAMINDTRAECTFKAPSSEGTFIFEGRWVDMLNKEEGKFKMSISVSKVIATQIPTTTITPTTTTPTTTIIITTTPPVTAKPTPGFEFITGILSTSLIVLRRWLR
ncbi:hypothetical protein DRP04_06260 [Archaeoglobales archaeon]|nr:MAG: hypothetical protein DRP04_06260 [Archaeoglobales archaeon]